MNDIHPPTAAPGAGFIVDKEVCRANGSHVRTDHDLRDQDWPDDAELTAALERLTVRFPWAASLSDTERRAFVTEMEIVVHAWRSTAEAYAAGVPRDGADLEWLDEPVDVERPTVPNSPDDLASREETRAVLSDPIAMAAIRQASAEEAAGQVVDGEDFLRTFRPREA